MDILLVDEHPVSASGLKELIASKFPELQVQTCTGLEEAKVILRQTSLCRLVLLDLNMKCCGAVDHIASMKVLPSLQSLCVLSASKEINKIESCLLAGASGYISKNYSPDLVLAAIKSVLEGGVFVPKEAFSALITCVRQFKKEEPSSSFRDLTARQKEVAGLICKGMSNKEIANKLGISEGTTKLHVSNIFSMMSVSKRSELIVRFGKSA